VVESIKLEVQEVHIGGVCSETWTANSNASGIGTKIGVHQVRKTKRTQIKQELTNVGSEQGCEIKHSGVHEVRWAET